MAHRGEAHQAPENTRSALQRCIEDGLEWAEIEIRRTKDGQHILADGPTLTDNNGKSWEISEANLSELDQIDLGSCFAERYRGEQVLSLKDALGLCKGRLNLCLNYKAAQPEQLAREILRVGMEKQVVVSAELPALLKIKAVSDGKVAVMAKWDPALGGPEWASSNNLAVVEIEPENLKSVTCAGFKALGIKVEANVLNQDQPQTWERAYTAGADWVRTDFPEEVAAQALWRTIPRRPVEVSLHRGANRYAPENTLPAFAKAVRMGSDYVEFDVRTIADGGFFLLHDSRLDRTTDASGPIDQLKTDALRQISAGSKFGREYASVRIPSLDEFLQEFTPKVGLYFDAKVIAPAALAEALERHHAIERTVVYQSPKFLEELKAINPRIRGLAPLGRADELPGLLATLKPYGVDANWGILSKDLIDRCHAAGVRVFSDSMGRHERIDDYLQAMEWGIDVIQTDHPLRVFRAIELRMQQKDSAAKISP
jgi:glycerophosphoryl diester phosphodiesterase